MKVEFFSYSYAPTSLKKLWLESLSNVIDSGRFIGGDFVNDFEQKFAKLAGARFAVGVSNGLDGLEIALRVLNIGKGDTVAVPAHTFIATWNAVLAVGAVPIGVDVGMDAQMDVNQFQEIASKHKISCVIPVHMHGHMSDMNALSSICENLNIPIIEDASQSHFAERDGNFPGKSSALAVFSLYPTKNLGALGDAGVIITNDQELAIRAKKLANYGSEENNKYLHGEVGYNKRLDAMQAAILINNLDFIEQWNSIRRDLAQIYSNFCNDQKISYLMGEPGSVWHHFCIKTNNRDSVQNFLFEHGVGTDIHYPFLAAHEVEKFSGLEKRSYPIAQALSHSLLSLPISQFHSREMIHYVGETLVKARSKGLLS